MSLWNRQKTDAAPRKPPRILQGQASQDNEVVNSKQDGKEPETILSPEASLTSGASSGYSSQKRVAMKKAYSILFDVRNISALMDPIIRILMFTPQNLYLMPQNPLFLTIQFVEVEM